MKIIFMLLLSSLYIFAFDASLVKAQILSKIAHEFVKKDVVNIWTDDVDLMGVKGLDSSLKFTSTKDADIVFIANKDTLSQAHSAKYIFSTSYYLYQKVPNVMGVFFWQKGRPNIIIKSVMLKKLHISLSETFQKYIE